MSPTPDSARSRRLSRHVRPTDLQAASQLITLATHGLIDVTATSERPEPSIVLSRRFEAAGLVAMPG